MTIYAVDVRFLDDVKLEMTFQDGKVVRYDMSKMFNKYPQLVKLREDRELFINGKLDPGGFGIIWDDELDFDAMSIYEDGEIVGKIKPTLNQAIGVQIAKAREKRGITQVDLSKMSHIDQADISKLEKGQGNPTISKISKILDALDCDLEIVVNKNNKLRNDYIKPASLISNTRMLDKIKTREKEDKKETPKYHSKEA